MQMEKFKLLNIPISSLSMDATVSQVCNWAKERTQTRLVTFTTVHMLVEGTKDKSFLRLLNDVDLNCPDGMPLVWLGRILGGKTGTTRVCGPEFLPKLCSSTEARGFKHFFYGGADGVAEETIQNLKAKNPDLEVVGSYTPPFRKLTQEEDAQIVDMINSSGADFVWVCLGCPKQERWIHEHRDQLKAPVLLAVGMAFDIAAGRKKRAPAVLRKTGLEWLHRLFQEPGRLWKRYLVYNTLFIYALFEQALWPRKLEEDS
jgi:N-acetylglucosaminyldiphosphoundecaprenol N-acetyl-beta-D-mannosaminyltransferase